MLNNLFCEGLKIETIKPKMIFKLNKSTKVGQTRVETENKIHTRTIKISCKISLKEVSLEFYLTGKLATFCQLGKCLVLKSYSDTVFRNLLANLQKST